MASPYSYDLRAKAIKAVKSGEKKVNVCRMFAISRNTLNLWLKREQVQGDFKAIALHQKGKKPKIKNLLRFQEFVLQHNNKTQQRIAQLWGKNLTQQNVSDAIRKLGITRKKAVRPRVADRRKTKGLPACTLTKTNLWVSREK